MLKQLLRGHVMLPPALLTRALLTRTGPWQCHQPRPPPLWKRAQTLWKRVKYYGSVHKRSGSE